MKQILRRIICVLATLIPFWWLFLAIFTVAVNYRPHPIVFSVACLVLFLDALKWQDEWKKP